MRRTWAYGSLLAVTGLLTGCAQTEPVEVIDLNRVLDILVQVLDDSAGGAAEQTQLTATNETDGAETGAEAEVVPVPEDPTKTKAFLNRYASALNAANLIQSPIGVHIKDDGSIEGFVDSNQNMVREADDEPHLFRVQIDAEGSRLIASDESGPEHFHRDRQYRFRPGGFFMGYMLGSMLNRQNSYHQSAGTRPGFRNMQMSPQNYHSNAVAKAQTRARGRTSSPSSARTRSGSGGFRFGK
jgi:hypothetical protein